jgi:hypothetical protein
VTENAIDPKTAAGPSQTAAGRPKNTKNKGKAKQTITPRRENRKGLKRLRRSCDDDASDEDDQSNPGNNDPPGPGEATNEESGHMWACPWYLFDPERNYRCLGKYHLKTYKQMIEHCQRVHVLPRYYCARCWTNFRNSAEMSQHDYNACIQIPGPEELYEDEVYLLDTTIRRNPESRYFEMWGNVFAGYPRPASPYLSPGWAEPRRVLSERLHPWFQEQIPSLLLSYHDAIARGEDAVRLFTGNLMDVIDRVPTPPPRYRRRPPIPSPSDDEPGSVDPPAAVRNPAGPASWTAGDVGDGGDGAQGPEADSVDPPKTRPISQLTPADWTTNPQNPEEGPTQLNHPEYPEASHANCPDAPVNAGEPRQPIHLNAHFLGPPYVSPSSPQFNTNAPSLDPHEVPSSFDTLQDLNRADSDLDDSIFDIFVHSGGVSSQ